MLSLRGLHGDRLPIVPHDLTVAGIVVWMYQATLLIWALWLLAALLYWLRWGLEILREQHAARRARARPPHTSGLRGTPPPASDDSRSARERQAQRS